MNGDSLNCMLADKVIAGDRGIGARPIASQADITSGAGRKFPAVDRLLRCRARQFSGGNVMSLTIHLAGFLEIVCERALFVEGHDLICPSFSWTPPRLCAGSKPSRWLAVVERIEMRRHPGCRRPQKQRRARARSASRGIRVHRCSSAANIYVHPGPLPLRNIHSRR
jgi:hypothetical protein